VLEITFSLLVTGGKIFHCINGEHIPLFYNLIHYFSSPHLFHRFFIFPWLDHTKKTLILRALSIYVVIWFFIPVKSDACIHESVCVGDARNEILINTQIKVL